MLYTEDGITPLDTVVDRLLWAKEQILQFPERYDQTAFAPYYMHGEKDFDCETVGCIAGWLDLHVYGERVHFNCEGGVHERARRALGLPETGFRLELFNCALVNAAGDDKRAQAELAAKKIDEYITKITSDAVKRKQRRF